MQTFTGTEYLKIDIAANFGLDKKDWDERLAWFETNEPILESLITQSDTPALFFAGVQAYRATQRGRATGYPISLDATASGLQLLACLTGCIDSARLCNVVSTGHREDAYTVIYKAMCDQLGTSTNIEREDCKYAIMTSLYSSTSVPKTVFGEGEQLTVFFQTMETQAPGAWALNQALQALWRPYALSHDWVLPDNFHVHVKVVAPVSHQVQVNNAPVTVVVKANRGTESGKSISPNIIHSIDGMIVREMQRRCSYDPAKIEEVLDGVLRPSHGKSVSRDKDKLVKRLWAHYQVSGFLSARILENLDVLNLGHVDVPTIKAMLGTLPEKPFDLISIHDCWRVLPNYGNDLRRQYNLILAVIAKSDLLAFIASQVAGRIIPVKKQADISALILEADYAIS